MEFNIINNYLKNLDDKFVFYGASLFLKSFLEQYPQNTEKVLGIIDKNPEKWGQSFCGLEIYSPEILSKLGKVNLIMTIKNSNAYIYDRLKQYIELKRIGFECLELNLLPNIFSQIKSPTNKIILVYQDGTKEVSSVPGLSIRFKGENSVIEIGADPLPLFNESSITMRSNCSMKIGSSSSTINSLNIYMNADNACLTIGDGFGVVGAKLFMDFEKMLKVSIGNDCLFSRDVYIWASDAHSIYDLATREVVNTAKDIKIGNHVWLCQNTTILKGAEIPDNTVVGNFSLVNKKFEEENTVIAGIPAQVKKRNIGWSRKSPDKY